MKLKIGETYERLTVISKAGKHPTRRDTLWKCRCTCGKEIIIPTRSITSGNTSSCGCLQKEKTTANTIIQRFSPSQFLPEF